MMKWSLVLFLIAATRSAKGQNEVYQVIYPSEDLHGSKGDAVIFLNEPDQAAGGSDLIVGCNNNGQCARSLLHFNVDSLLPDDAVITDVQMTLLPAASVAVGDPPMTLNVHQVTTPWSRTGESTPDGERDSWPDSLQGTVANDGDVTWKYSVYPTDEWTTEGGDVNNEVMTTVVSEGYSGRASPLFFPMTDEFKRVVTGWIDGSIPNNGVMVKRDNEDPSDNTLRIMFHEESGNKDYRSPKLLITYTSVSQPEQAPSAASGPGILLPGEPTQAPVTSAPTTAPSCSIAGAEGVEVYTGTSSQHASIALGKGDLSQDKGPFGVGIVHSGEILRGLIQFPVDAIPKGSTITCAEIILKTTGPCGPCKGVVDVEMHRIASPWTTTGTTDFLPQQQPLLQQVELQVAGANTGDVTWTHSTYNAADPSKGTKWGTEGGDVEANVISAEVDNERGQHKFPTSEGFVDAIQGFVDGTFENNGFLFKTEEHAEYVAMKAEENDYKDYDTAYRLFKAEDEEDEASKPLLVVHYVPPTVDASVDITTDTNGSSDATSSVVTSLTKVFVAVLTLCVLGLN